MATLLDRLRAEPGSVFAVKFELPTGRVVEGTVGPMVNGKVCANVGFDQTATEEEIAMARTVMDELMGCAPEFMQVAEGPEEYQTAKAIGDAYMSGGSKEVN